MFIKLIPASVIWASIFSLMYGLKTHSVGMALFCAVLVLLLFLIRLLAFGNVELHEVPSMMDAPTTPAQKLVKTIYPYDMLLVVLLLGGGLFYI